MAVSSQSLIPRQLVILAGCLGELGAFALGDIRGRIDAQKRIYLLQVAGVNLGYRFTWDLFGPFSRGLANDVAIYRGQADSVNALTEELELTEDAARKLTDVRSLIQVPSEFEAEITDIEWLELVASLHFMAMTLFGWRPISKLGSEEHAKVAKALADRKPHLRKFSAEAKRALELLASIEGHAESRI